MTSHETKVERLTKEFAHIMYEYQLFATALAEWDKLSPETQQKYKQMGARVSKPEHKPNGV